MGAIAAYDVVVLGAGVAGCAAAIALADRARRLLAVEAAVDHAEPRVGESVPPDARTLFRQLGLWRSFAAQRHEPCLGSCSAWGEAALGYNDFLRHPLGHGWHLDRPRFNRFMAQQAQERGVELLRGARYRTAERGRGGGYLLRLQTERGEHCVRARFVVDATGRRAHFARSQGARRWLHDQLLCSAADFDLPPGAEFSSLTLLEAVEYGWWYAARLPRRRVTAVVAIEPHALRGLGLHQREHWLARLRATSQLGPHFAKLDLASAPRLCVAASCLLSPPAGMDWLAVGDAAACYDPISSLGIYKALADGLRAAPLVERALAGDPQATSAHVRSVALKFSEYAFHRQRFYQAESRWPEAEFWRTRRSRTALLAESPRGAASSDGPRPPNGWGTTRLSAR